LSGGCVTGVVLIFPCAILLRSILHFVLLLQLFYGSVDVPRLVQVVMPLAEPPQWRRKATDFFSTSSKCDILLFVVNHSVIIFCTDIPTSV